MLWPFRVVVIAFASFAACSSPDVPASAPAPSGELTATVIASGVANVFRLGDDVLVAHARVGAPAAIDRILRDGTAVPVAIADMPAPTTTTSRGGHDVVSGTPTALLGRAAGPTWMGWSTYATFGHTDMIRVDGGRAVPDNEPWNGALTTEHRYVFPEPEDAAPGITPEVIVEHDPRGEARSAGRGRLLALVNLVSSDVTGWIALPQIGGTADAATLARGAVDLGQGGTATELPDGTIVHVDKDTVTCLRGGARTSHALPREAAAVVAGALALEPRSCDELVLLASAGELVVASGKRLVRSRVPLAVTGLAIADDGSVWLTTNGPEAFREHGGAWRAVRWSGPTEGDLVVAITREALFVARASQLLRVSLP